MSELVLEKEEIGEIKLSEEPKISLIVPVYKTPKEELKRCLMSLEDQNYSNMEVIIVFDGIDQDLIRVDSPYLKDKRFKIIEIEHAGACEARNKGFEASTGDIISFFHSDYIAKPGMVSMWIDELMAHKDDCGFIYGAYEWLSAGRSSYPSKQFDAWELTQANYIDAGFPLWRKYVVPWDSSVKSLQDWDFWLRVIKTHNVKGHYLGREISYGAALPKDGGLSSDSSKNWVDRVNFVKEKNGISISEVLVTSLGAPYHAKEIAKMIGADFRNDTIYKPHIYKGLYMLGFYLKPNDVSADHARILAHYKGIKRIVHFIGADIYWLKKFSFENLKHVAGALSLECDHIFSENELAQKELLDLGIKSEIVPIPPYTNLEVKPLPEEFTVSTFLTDRSDFDKYCQEETLSIIRAMPDVKFTAYGDAAKGIEYPNLKVFGNLTKEEWEKYVYNNSCYLRLARHDTRPMASDEFMLAGRYVVTNIPGDGMDYIDTTGIPEKNEWDIFGSGLSKSRWPATKKKIVQKIRELKKNAWGKEYRQLIHDKYAKVLDKNVYIAKIKECMGK